MFDFLTTNLKNFFVFIFSFCTIQLSNIFSFVSVPLVDDKIENTTNFDFTFFNLLSECIELVLAIVASLISTYLFNRFFKNFKSDEKKEQNQ